MRAAAQTSPEKAARRSHTEAPFTIRLSEAKMRVPERDSRRTTEAPTTTPATATKIGQSSGSASFPKTFQAQTVVSERRLFKERPAPKGSAKPQTAFTTAPPALTKGAANSTSNSATARTRWSTPTHGFKRGKTHAAEPSRPVRRISPCRFITTSFPTWSFSPTPISRIAPFQTATFRQTCGHTSPKSAGTTNKYSTERAKEAKHTKARTT